MPQTLTQVLSPEAAADLAMEALMAGSAAQQAVLGTFELALRADSGTLVTASPGIIADMEL